MVFEKSYREYIVELGDEERYPYPLDLDDTDFEALIATLRNYSLGRELPFGLVPNSTYWLVSNNEILGCAHLRHNLNAALLNAGGHIGLGIRPKVRGMGLSKILLSQTLVKAKKIGIDKVHIHCYQSNVQSTRMIASTGAALDSVFPLPNSNNTVMRFILDIGAKA